MKLYFEGYLFDFTEEKFKKVEKLGKLVSCLSVIGLDFSVHFVSNGKFYFGKYSFNPAYYLGCVRTGRSREIIRKRKIDKSKFSYLEILKEITGNEEEVTKFNDETSFFDFRDSRIDEEIENGELSSESEEDDSETSSTILSIELFGGEKPDKLVPTPKFEHSKNPEVIEIDLEDSSDNNEIVEETVDPCRKVKFEIQS